MRCFTRKPRVEVVWELQGKRRKDFLVWMSTRPRAEEFYPPGSQVLVITHIRIRFIFPLTFKTFRKHFPRSSCSERCYIISTGFYSPSPTKHDFPGSLHAHLHSSRLESIRHVRLCCCNHDDFRQFAGSNYHTIPVSPSRLYNTCWFP